MVKHSLEKLLDKYPYFLDKRSVSNFYKVTDVNNSIFKELYNSLFDVYESFHLNKRLLVWRTQDKPYAYQTHFCCTYPNIKTVEIFKNDILIHREEFSEEENKTDYCWTYDCSYTKTNMLPIKVYRCTVCGEIYFGDTLPIVCDECGSSSYIVINMYECDNCGEIYFTNNVDTIKKNPSYDLTNGQYITITGYKCSVCGEVYEEIPLNCINQCQNHTYTEVTLYKCPVCGELHESIPTNSNDEVSNSFTKIRAYKCLGEDHDGSCGEIYLGSEPPVICDVCHTESSIENKDLYYNDLTITIIDNSADYNEDEDNEIIVMGESVEVSPNNLVLDNGHIQFKICVKDYHNNPLQDMLVMIGNTDEYYDGYTDENGYCLFELDNSDNHYILSVIDENANYLSINGSPSLDYELDTNESVLIDVTFYSEEDYNQLIRTEIDYIDTTAIVTEDDYNIESMIDSEENYLIPFPVIPDDLFLFNVTTWDEHSDTKGYPENDEMSIGEVEESYGNDCDGTKNHTLRREWIHSPYDHDYSLDEIGALNNIPRKKYQIIDDESLYPLTEPPFNKYATEDDYHYMKRMLEYNLRMWCDNNLVDIKIGDDVFNGEMEAREFREKYNPVTNEIWKLYGIPSRLINRERYLLKVFDISKHNKKDTSDDALSECWTPVKWEHKDKFCDGSILYGEYFFVECDNLRPVKWENVTFHFQLINSLAETIDDYYDVTITYYYNHRKPSNSEEVNTLITNFTGDEITVHWKIISLKEPTTFVFTPHNDVLGEEDSVEITLYPRNCDNADWYVDANVSATGNGSIEAPFKTLDEALRKVTNSFNLIALKSDIEIDSPLFVENNTIILGCNLNASSSENRRVPIIRKVPRVANEGENEDFVEQENITNSRKFFNIAGGKNCSLNLVDVHLASGLLDTWVGSNKWINSNKNLTKYESVVINGGLVNINVEILNGDAFFPTDNIELEITLTDKNNLPVNNTDAILTFNGSTPITVTSDSNGIIHYVLEINELEPNTYNLNVKVPSDLYFETEVNVSINAEKEPNTIHSPTLIDTIELTGHTNMIGETLNVYSNRELLDTVDVDNNGGISLEYEHEWGVNVVLFVDSNGNVIEMVIVETVLELSLLNNVKLIKNFDINTTTGDVTYDSITIGNNTTVGDLDGVVVGMTMNNTNLTTNYFSVEEGRTDSVTLSFSEALTLSNALKTISFNNTSFVISYTVLGEFWQ